MPFAKAPERLYITRVIGRVAWSLFSAALMVWAATGVPALPWSDPTSAMEAAREGVGVARRWTASRAPGRQNSASDFEAVAAAFSPFCLASAQWRFLSPDDDFESGLESWQPRPAPGTVSGRPVATRVAFERVSWGGAGPRAPPRA